MFLAEFKFITNLSIYCVKNPTLIITRLNKQANAAASSYLLLTVGTLQ